MFRSVDCYSVWLRNSFEKDVYCFIEKWGFVLGVPGRFLERYCCPVSQTSLGV